MKTVTKQFYQCDICATKYPEETEASLCESKPVSQDKGVEVGDIVLITHGDSSGKKARVTRKIIFSKDWGYYQSERYWHTVGLEVKVINDIWCRLLVFDNYTVC